MPNTGSVDTLHALLKEAGNLYHALTEWSGDGLGKTLATEAKRDAKNLNNLSTMVDRLRNHPAEALADAKKMFRLNDATTVEDAIGRAVTELKENVAAIKESAAFKRIGELMRNATGEIVEKTRKGSAARRAARWAENAFTGHQQWLEHASTGQRMAFGAGCIGLGSLCMYAGGELLAQGFYGQATKRVKATDEKGNTATIVIPRPLSAAERTVKVVLGAGTAGIGLVGFNKGFVDIFFHGR